MQKVFIFDYDGVIVDSFDIFLAYFLKACAKENITDITTNEDFLSLYDNNMYENMFRMGMNKQQILRIVHFMKNAIIQNKENIKLFPEIKKTLHILSQYHTLYIVTSSDTNLVSDFLKMFEINTYFHEIIGSDKQRSKTKKIMSIAQKHPDAECYYIGDTSGDIKEGKEANVKTIAVTWGWHDKKRLKKNQPDFLISTPKELLSISTELITN